MPRHQVSDLSQEGTPSDSKAAVDLFFEQPPPSKQVNFAVPQELPASFKAPSYIDDEGKNGGGYLQEEQVYQGKKP